MVDLKIAPGDQRVVTLHQHLVLRHLSQTDSLHRPHHPHSSSGQGACSGRPCLNSHPFVAADSFHTGDEESTEVEAGQGAPAAQRERRGAGTLRKDYSESSTSEERWRLAAETNGPNNSTSDCDPRSFSRHRVPTSRQRDKSKDHFKFSFDVKDGMEVYF